MSNPQQQIHPRDANNRALIPHVTFKPVYYKKSIQIISIKTKITPQHSHINIEIYPGNP